MSYITLPDGTEVTDIESLRYKDGFIEALETRIIANNEAGKPPFDGIDFPDMSGGYFNSHILADRLNDNKTFIKALETQCRGQNDPKKVLDFIGSLDLTKVLDKSEKEYDQGLFGVLYDRTSKDKSNLTASTATWAIAFATKHNEPGNFGWFSDEIERFEENSEKLEGESVKALEHLLKRNDYLHLNISYMAGVLERSDLQSLDDASKKRLEEVISSGHSFDRKIEKPLDHYIENSPVTNLSEEAFLKRKNITLEDVQTYYGIRGEPSPTNLLYKLDYTKENNELENFTESMNKLRGELAVKYIMETEPEQVDYQIVGKFSKDICQGFKDNPEALKKLGVTIPSSVVDVLEKDEHFKHDIQFIAGTKEVSSVFGNRNSLEKSIDLLNQVAEKGFSAGYGAEMIVLKAGKVLEEKRSEYELAKKNLQTVLKKREEYNQAKERFDILDKVKQDIGTYLYKDEKIFQQLDPSLNKEEILKMAIDKAKGKDVKKMECTDKPTKGLKRLFMSKAKKEKEQKDIKAKEEAYSAINRFVEDMGNKWKDTKTVNLLDGCSIDTVNKQWSEDYEYIEYNRSTVEHSKWTEKDARKLVEEFEKMETAQKAAQTKLDYQVTIAKTARETSGVKDIETKTGFDAMEVKAQLRAENPNMSVRDLYASMKEIRDKGEYSAEIKVKAPKDDKVKNDINKLSILRGTKAQEAKPVKQTSLSPQMMQNRLSNTKK